MSSSVTSSLSTCGILFREILSKFFMLIAISHLWDEELFRDNFCGQVFKHLECFVHGGTLPTNLRGLFYDLEENNHPRILKFDDFKENKHPEKHMPTL